MDDLEDSFNHEPHEHVDFGGDVKLRLPGKLCEGWCEEVAEDGLCPCRSVVRSSRWRPAFRKTEVEEADDSSSRQESLFPCRFSWKSTFCDLWMGRWRKEQQKAWREADS